MIVKQTVVDQIEIPRNGTIQIRLALELVEDGNKLSSKWHRTVVTPGHDIAAQLAAVNKHLAQMGEAAVSDVEIGRVSAQAAVAWTPEVVAAYQAQQALLAKQAPTL